MNDSAYTLHLEPTNKRRPKGRFQKGNIPWNKGISWEQQGIVGEEAKRRKEAFQKAAHKNGYSHKPTHSKPVIQMDMDGNRLHWYISSNEAARKLGLHGRNIRKVCDGERNHTGGFRFKWDERFLT
jgi:hypothetical protein